MLRKTRLLALLLCAVLLLTGCSELEDAGLTVPEVPVDISVPELEDVLPDIEVTLPDLEGVLPENDTTDGVTETATVPDGSSFEIHYIDVGQADSALVICDGEAMLIDGGNSEDSSLIYAYLEQHGVDHLEYVVATHAHEDHCGGLAGGLTYATADTAYSPVTETRRKAPRFSHGDIRRENGFSCNI